jgi:hypothetical protein
MSLLDAKNVKVIEVDENNQRLDDIERVNTDNLPAKKEKKLKYAWLFFIASIMITKAISHTLHIHGVSGLGVGIGLLFFIPNVYNKVMEKINNL